MNTYTAFFFWEDAMNFCFFFFTIKYILEIAFTSDSASNLWDNVWSNVTPWFLTSRWWISSVSPTRAIYWTFLLTLYLDLNTMKSVSLSLCFGLLHFIHTLISDTLALMSGVVFSVIIFLSNYDIDMWIIRIWLIP